MAENPLHRLTAEQIEAIGRELDELHEEVSSDLGDRDAAYIVGGYQVEHHLYTDMPSTRYRGETVLAAGEGVPAATLERRPA